MSELKSLANTEQFPAGVRVSIMRDMVVSSSSKFPADNGRRFVYAWDGEVFICARVEGRGINSWQHAAEIPTVKMRQKTREEVLGFIAHNPHIVVRVYNGDWDSAQSFSYSKHELSEYEWATITADGVIWEPRRFEVEVDE